MSVRHPPYRDIMRLHGPVQRGTCQWCGLACAEVTAVKKLPRSWHAQCRWEFDIITQPERARDAVGARDRGVCRSCGEDWWLMSRFEAEFRNPDGTAQISHNYAARIEDRIAYTSLRVVSLWHVDHIVPLWKSADLPAVQRIEYFKLANLQTLCDPCHARKSRDETAERSHIKRLVRRRAEPQKALPW